MPDPKDLTVEEPEDELTGRGGTDGAAAPSDGSTSSGAPGDPAEQVPGPPADRHEGTSASIGPPSDPASGTTG